MWEFQLFLQVEHRKNGCCCAHLLQCLKDLYDGPMHELYTMITIYAKSAFKENAKGMNIHIED